MHKAHVSSPLSLQAVLRNDAMAAGVTDPVTVALRSAPAPAPALLSPSNLEEDPGACISIWWEHNTPCREEGIKGGPGGQFSV